MSVTSVLRMGEPLLFQKSAPVEDILSPDIQAIIQDMWDTARHLNGAGIAAPQLGHPYRIVLFGIPTPRYAASKEVPATVLINPEITVLDNTEEFGWEGCLSVPSIRGVVPRFAHILYSGYDAQGHRFEREAMGFHARVVQHECDHLDGVLFPGRVRDFTQFGFEDELGLNKSRQPQGTVTTETV